MRPGEGRGRGGFPRNAPRPRPPLVQQRISFLSLPAEIRNSIYKAAISASQDKIHFPLGGTCSQVYREINAMRFLDTRLTIELGFEGEIQNASPDTSRQCMSSVCIHRKDPPYSPPPTWPQGQYWPPGPYEVLCFKFTEPDELPHYMPLALIPEIELRLLDGQQGYPHSIVLLQFSSNKDDSPSIEIGPYRKPDCHDRVEQYEIARERRGTIDPIFKAMRNAVLREWAIWQTREADSMRFSHGLFDAIMQHVKPAHWDTLCSDYEQPWYWENL